MEKDTKKAFDFLCKRNVLSDYWDQSTYVSKLTDFIKNKGEKALQALAGFYLWIIHNIDTEEKQSSLLTSTFSHDLGQSNDEWMEPRSSNYLEFWNNRNF